MRQRLVEASWRRNRARAGTHAISARSSSLTFRGKRTSQALALLRVTLKGSGERVEAWFQMDGLEVERLLADWRWLCPSKAVLLARNVFGELFLQDETGAILWLNTTTGKLSKVADSKAQFLQLAETSEKRGEWFAEHEAKAYAQRGVIPGSSQCIGFGVPAVFAEGGTPATAYIADIYEHVSFLGDLHQQIVSLPDGSKVRLRVNHPKPASSDQT